MSSFPCPLYTASLFDLSAICNFRYLIVPSRSLLSFSSIKFYFITSSISLLARSFCSPAADTLSKYCRCSIDSALLAFFSEIAAGAAAFPSVTSMPTDFQDRSLAALNLQCIISMLLLPRRECFLG